MSPINDSFYELVLGDYVRNISKNIEKVDDNWLLPENIVEYFMDKKLLDRFREDLENSLIEVNIEIERNASGLMEIHVIYSDYKKKIKLLSC